MIRLHKISNQDFIDGNMFKRVTELEAKSLPESIKSKLHIRQQRSDRGKKRGPYCICGTTYCAKHGRML